MGVLKFAAGNTELDAVTAVMVDEELVGIVAYRANNIFFHTLNDLKRAANDAVVAVEQAQNE
jgi:hypothetical protein